jgi:stress-induced morphogen
MPMAANDIIALIESGIPGARVTIQDLRGDGDHYAVRVMAQAFQGLPKIRQHMMVYQALGTRMGNELHALSIETTVEENV